jgi:uncharacterized RDD family membrane protein YckC
MLRGTLLSLKEPSMASAAAAPVQPASRNYAGFWIRVVAYLIDAVLLGIPTSILFAVFGGGISALVGSNQDPSTINVAALFGALGTVILIVLAIHFCYFIFMESSEKQATVGKMVLSLKVTDVNGRRISIGQSVGRTLSKLLSSILYIGYIMVGVTEKKQGLHDMIAGTFVVRTN